MLSEHSHQRPKIHQRFSSPKFPIVNMHLLNRAIVHVNITSPCIVNITAPYTYIGPLLTSQHRTPKWGQYFPLANPFKSIQNIMYLN